MDPSTISPIIDGSDALPQPGAGDYWNGLISEKAAAVFYGVTVRTMQKLRQGGNGPKYIRLPSRCIRYRRIDLKADVDARIRSSTADEGEAA